MANKQLQSIKFPGLSDTYIVPQIDDTLSVKGRAADAKVTGKIRNDLAVVKETVGMPPSVEKSNAGIYLNAGYDFNASIANANRVSTKPIYIPDGASYKISASGFGRHAYISSYDGETVVYGSTFKEGTSYERTFTGPLYVRFLFANATETPINTDSVVISVDTGVKNIVERVSDVEDETEELSERVAAVESSAATIEDINEDITTINEIIGVSSVSVIKSNETIYLNTGGNFAASIANNKRVSTKPIYVPDGESYTISASGFGRYGYSVSTDGSTNSYAVPLKSGTSFEHTFTGPIYFRCIFANETETAISTESVIISVDDGTKPINERVETVETKIENDFCLDSFGHYIHVPQNNIGNDIVATYKKMYVRNNNGILQLSVDSGKTWNDGFDVSSVGLIKTYHLFNNGCIGFFTHQKAYYSEDWENFYEASVYEADGTAYTPSTYDNFTVSRDNPERLYINGQDLFVFGNYGITDENNTRRIIWYSKDNGHSYKVIYEFNVEGNRQIRHIHNVIYNPNNNHFLCCTGDTNLHSFVIQMDYDPDNDEWTLTTLGNNTNYKWAGVAFFGAYVYFCYDNTPGKVMKCRYNDIGDTTKWETVLDNLPNDAIGLFIGERGDMLVSVSKYRSGNSNSPFGVSVDSRRLFYSPDRVKFYDFIGDNPGGYAETIYYGFTGVNGDGKIISGLWSGPVNLASWNKLPCVYLDQMVKRFGFPNAFKPYDTAWEIVPVVDVECEDVSVAVGSSVTIVPKLYPYNATSVAFSIVDYDSSIISVNGATITGNSAGTTTAKVRSKTNYGAYAEITITVV